MAFIQSWNWQDNIDEYMDTYYLNQELVHEDDDCLKYDFHLFRRDVYTNKFNFIETLNWSSYTRYGADKATEFYAICDKLELQYQQAANVASRLFGVPRQV
jgi:hypothetical protein